MLKGLCVQAVLTVSFSCVKQEQNNEDKIWDGTSAGEIAVQGRTLNNEYMR